MRIPFDISKRPQIESGEYKVVYVENSSSEQCPVEILKWDSNSDAGCIIGCVRRKGKDRIYAFQENGVHTVSDEDDRLFLVTPEPEMSEMEISLLSWLSDDTSGEIPMERMKQVVKARAAELLALAKSQLLQSGELLTQEHHEKLVESLNNAHEEELEKAYKNADEVQYRKGREDALKDLPRWRKCPEIEYYAFVYNCAKREDSLLYYNGHTLRLIDLEKLPGFKEESHE